MKLKKTFINEDTIKKVITPSKLDIINKEISAVGGVKILIFDVSNAIELLSAFFAIILAITVIIICGIFNHASLKAIVMLLVGVLIVSYCQYKKPIDNYKKSFLKDTELPVILETIIQGLNAGLPIENVFRYIKKNKTGNTAKLIAECIDKNDSGMDFNTALKEVADKSLNRYFIRMYKIIKKSDISVLGLSEQLSALQIDIEEDRLNLKEHIASNLDNALYFPILIGYFVPSVAMIFISLLQQTTKMQGLIK